MTDTKPRATLSEIPLLVDRNWIRHHIGVGTSTIIELEKAGVLKPVDVPGIRTKKYETAEILTVLGLAGTSENAG